MMFPSKRELLDDKRSQDRKRLEEKREDEKRFDDKRHAEVRDVEERAWNDFLEERKRSDQDRKREIEKRHIRHLGLSPLEQLEQAFLRKWYPTETWKRSADSLGNARNGL